MKTQLHTNKNELKLIGHFCFMQPISPIAQGVEENNECSEKFEKKYLYVFYYFEKQQSLFFEGDEEKKIHVLNLCVAHKPRISDCKRISNRWFL